VFSNSSASTGGSDRMQGTDGSHRMQSALRLPLDRTKTN